MTAPRSKAKTNKTTSASEWKKKAQIPPLELPSGCYMRVRKIGLQSLMSMGIMPNSLMAISQRAVNAGKGQPAGMEDEELLDLVNDPKKVKDITDFMDKMLCVVAQEPEVHPVPAPGVERDDELLYTDEVDEEDKMFIFQVVTGGTTDIAEFRRESGTAVAAVRGRQDLALPTE